jgi:hypothetical protein
MTLNHHLNFTRSVQYQDKFSTIQSNRRINHTTTPLTSYTRVHTARSYETAISFCGEGLAINKESKKLMVEMHMRRARIHKLVAKSHISKAQAAPSTSSSGRRVASFLPFSLSISLFLISSRTVSVTLLHSLLESLPLSLSPFSLLPPHTGKSALPEGAPAASSEELMALAAASWKKCLQDTTR